VEGGTNDGGITTILTETAVPRLPADDLILDAARGGSSVFRGYGSLDLAWVRLQEAGLVLIRFRS